MVAIATTRLPVRATPPRITDVAATPAVEPDAHVRAHGRPPLSVDALCRSWRAALDAADEALHAAQGTLPPDEIAARARQLDSERKATLELIRAFASARGSGARYVHLARPHEARRLLGLPTQVEACVFNLDGVLIGSSTLHAAAWRETFDEFVWARVERTHGRFAPFDAHFDYARYLHGRPRLDGVRLLLASRGISLPEGTPYDPPGTETVHGLANRKNEILRRRIDERGVTAYEGATSYLQTVLEAGLHTAVVSASANTATILELSGLAPLVECTVDGNTMIEQQLRSKPAPDTLLAASRQLDVSPGHAAAFETTAAGVDAARAAGYGVVVGIDQFSQAAALRAHGAAPVVSGLAEILEGRLAA